MEGWLEGGLWLDLAARANARAAALGRGLAALRGVTLAHPVEANAVFASWPRGLHRAAMAAGAEYYLWDFDATLDGPDDEPLLARLVCGWSTTEEEVAAFVDLIRTQGRRAGQPSGKRSSG
jgi:threonine aldolase